LTSRFRYWIRGKLEHHYSDGGDKMPAVARKTATPEERMLAYVEKTWDQWPRRRAPSLAEHPG
jgi:hypothetical protein